MYIITLWYFPINISLINPFVWVLIHFPTYNKSAADNFENISTIIWKISLNEDILYYLILNRVENIEWRLKFKRRNCFFGEISSFAWKFSVACCRSVRKRLHEGKGRNSLIKIIILIQNHSSMVETQINVLLTRARSVVRQMR